jgi:hypothetical protein
MTKKDYSLIAKQIKASLIEFNNQYRPIQHLAICLAAELYHQNNRFDNRKFLTACGFCSECNGYGTVPLIGRGTARCEQCGGKGVILPS